MLPNQMVRSLVGKMIRVEMKGEENELVGVLEGVDDYMNLCLTNAMECKNGEKIRNLGTIVLRGNNIVIIQPLDRV
ncbi:LSM domain-containing protein [Archaeoglobus profundus]|uniref:Like-Sm ribonucleoprotein core n=1 Tax=Archaeoglobus profundus (strain DSM 5631 / JCM 9629 / NBRC 100127 / Av18) TaxID=572546 RepID=D2RHR8_ARCPA|nr:LSM domain-containing protein [Archaeoglobus profundus]ADB57843.1 Like-Sm ribonucleoprotein core [Archaeoglobus profundus DSM 5631]